MLKYITVPIIVDDHQPEKCGLTKRCQFDYYEHTWCELYGNELDLRRRCKQCLEEAK